MDGGTDLEGFICRELGCSEFVTTWERSQIHEKKFGHKMEAVRYASDPEKPKGADEYPPVHD